MGKGTRAIQRIAKSCGWDLEEAKNFCQQVQWQVNGVSYQKIEDVLKHQNILSVEDVVRVLKAQAQDTPTPPQQSNTRQKTLLQVTENTHAKLFAGAIAKQVVMLTGDGPFKKDNLVDLLKKLDAILFTEQIDLTKVTFVVVGTEEFDKRLLRKALDGAKKAQFVSQEEFLNHLLFNQESKYYQGDPRINMHQGLSYLASIGFKWPVLNESPISRDHRKPNTNHLNKESLLYQMGYNVAQSTTKTQRRQALRKAVEAPDIGLKDAAYHIASQWRLHSSHLEARKKWKSDLDWLYREYYQNRNYHFGWPTIGMPS